MLNDFEGTVGESQPFLLSIDFTGKKEYNYVYEDGVIVRSTECDITVNGENVEDRSPVCTVLYTYNGGTLVKKRIIPENGFDTEQVYTYPKDNGNTASCTFVRGDTTVTATSVTDGLGRAVSESITAGNVTISRAFTYTDGVAPLTGAPLDTNEYKPTTQLVKTIELSDGTVLDYEYDACGRITKVTETRNGTATVTEYTYDALGQLTSETVNGTVVNAMTYDSYGNILTKNGVSYSYDSTWKDRLVSVGNKTITYGTDPCNPATYFGNALVWEKGRQLKQFGNYTYKYNANGIRTDKWENGVQHVYTLDGAKILREDLVVGETYGNSVIVPIYDTNESVIGLTRSDITGQVTYYFLKNLQGDIIAITDASGTVIARYTYDAWGKVLAVTDANGNSITSPFDIANVNPFRYRGYYYDTETGLYYLQSRYYDPGVGRFINADTAQSIVSEGLDSIGYNVFAYCENSPINGSDIHGQAFIRIVAKIILGILLGFFIQLLFDVLDYLLNLIKDIKAAFEMSDWVDYASSIASSILSFFDIKKRVVRYSIGAIQIVLPYLKSGIDNINYSNLIADFAFFIIGEIVGGILDRNRTKRINKATDTINKNKKKLVERLKTKKLNNKERKIKDKFYALGVSFSFVVNISNNIFNTVIDFVTK